jgi:hypothetical protein
MLSPFESSCTTRDVGRCSMSIFPNHLPHLIIFPSFQYTFIIFPLMVDLSCHVVGSKAKKGKYPMYEKPKQIKRDKKLEVVAIKEKVKSIIKKKTKKELETKEVQGMVTQS